MSTGRKIGKRACDACKIRKIKCTEVPPCNGCVAIGTACTFNKVPATRGPRNLRAKTIRQITQAQREGAAASACASASLAATAADAAPASSASALGDGAVVNSAASAGSAAPTGSNTPPSHSPSSSDEGVVTDASGSSTGTQRLPRQIDIAPQPQRTPIPSLVLRLCVYRLRLFPVWPIIAVEEIMASLHRDADDLESYVLANAVGAATISQLKLSETDTNDSATAGSMEAECQRSRMALQEREGGPPMKLNWLRTSFFLHVYHENQQPGGAKSLLYLREAITIAQIMGLHKKSSYAALPLSEQQMRRRILWLLFVTERGVAMLHKLPVALKSNIRFPSLDGSGVGEDEGHILPAFKKLANLFWIFDQSGAFDILQNSDDEDAVWSMASGLQTATRTCLDVVQRKLQEIPLDSDASNDVQRADIVVTRQWMQAVLWKVTMNHGRAWSSNQNVANTSSSLSHPIQIAKEFLQLISQLPSTAIEAHGPGMEFKIYEIASAVTDAVANNFRLPRASADGPRDILIQLQRVLASCRGGNKALLELLCARIAEIQDAGPPSFMGRNPTPRIQELDGDHWREDEGRARGNQAQPSLYTTIGRIPDSGLAFGQPLASFALDAAHDFDDQLHNFDGSFNTAAAEANGALDMLFVNGALWDGIGGGDDWMASVVQSNASGVFGNASTTQNSAAHLQRTYE